MKKGWQTKRIGDVSEVFDGPHATPKTVDAGPIFLGISALQDGVINLGETRHVTEEDFKKWTRRVRPQTDDVVFSYETRLGQAAIIPDGLECCLGRRMGLVRFKDGTVDSRFFLYQYISPQFREFLDSKTIRGATVDRISIKDFPSFPITVPPLGEQQRIVGVLDEAFAGLVTARAAAAKNLQNARALFASHLQSVFTQRGKGWVETTLGDAFETATGTTPPKINASNYGDFIPFVKPPELCDAPLDSAADNLSKAGSVVARTLPPKSILVSCIGNLGKIGLNTVAVAFNQQINAILPDVRKAIPELMFYQSLSSSFKEQLEGLAGGTTVPIVNKSKFNSVTIVLPPLREQGAIVAQLDALAAATHRLARLYTQKQAALAALKKSLLHQAFTGEL